MSLDPGLVGEDEFDEYPPEKISKSIPELQEMSVMGRNPGFIFQSAYFHPYLITLKLGVSYACKGLQSHVFQMFVHSMPPKLTHLQIGSKYITHRDIDALIPHLESVHQLCLYHCFPQYDNRDFDMPPEESAPPGHSGLFALSLILQDPELKYLLSKTICPNVSFLKIAYFSTSQFYKSCKSDDVSLANCFPNVISFEFHEFTFLVWPQME